MKISKSLVNLEKQISQKVKIIKKRKKDIFFFYPNLVVCGVRSVGKSTLLGLLVGSKEIFGHSIGETTRDVSWLYKNEDSKVFLQDSSGNKRQIRKHDIDSELLDFIQIIDLPGLDGDYEHITMGFFERNTVGIAVYLIDISKGLTEKDRKFLQMLASTSTEVLFILNKIDMIEGEEDDDVKEYFEQVIEDISNVFDSNRILGVIAFSAKKFAKEKIIKSVLRNVIILSAYIQNFILTLIDALENFIDEEKEAILTTILEQGDISEIATRWTDYGKKLIKGLDTNTVLNAELREKALKDITERLRKEFGESISKALTKFFEGRNAHIERFINRILAGFEEITPLSSTGVDVNVGDGLKHGDLHTFFKFSSTFATDETLMLSYVGTSFLSGAAAGLLFGGIAGLIIGGIASWIFREVKAREVKEQIAEEYGKALRKELEAFLSNLPDVIVTKRKEALTNSVFKDPNILSFYRSLRESMYELTLQLSYELLSVVVRKSGSFTGCWWFWRK